MGRLLGRLTHSLMSSVVQGWESAEAAPSSLVGGVTIGDAGSAGTIYEGYTLAVGDDFGALDILAPHRPRGKYFTTRTYLPGSRGSDTALGDQYDTDPFTTGHNDSNRGVPVGFDNMSVSGSVLTLLARRSTVGEQAHMSSARPVLGAMISGAGAFHWHADDATTGDIILEARVRFVDDAPGGWHPTFWVQSLNPTIAINSDEIDHEGNSQEAYFNKNLWTNSVRSGATSPTTVEHDGEFHTVSIIINKTNIRRYIDGVLNATVAENGNEWDKPQYALLTNHVVNSTFEGDAYDAAGWLANVTGSPFQSEWWRVWSRTGKAHYKPLVQVTDRNVDYGASLTFALPAAATIWGDGTVSEYLQVIYAEENEPGVTHASVFAQFPGGVSYNAGTREVTVNIATGKTGRMNFALSAWKDGCTGEPLRFAVNVGPIAVLPPSLGEPGASSIDLYALQNFGVLTSNGSARTATISVLGLAGSGLSYNDATGLITGTGIAGTYELTVTVTNSVGQTDTITGNAAVGSFSPADWSDVVEWWDASDNSKVFSDFAATTPAIAGSTSVQALVGKKLAAQLGNNVGAQTPEYVTDANGRKALDFVRANNDYLRTSNATVIAEVSAGDNPFTLLMAVKRGTPGVAGTPASFSPDTGSAQTHIRCGIGSTNTVGFFRTAAGVQVAANSAIDLVGADQWYTMAWCFRGTTVSIRLNGVLIVSDAAMDANSIVVTRMSIGGRYDDDTNVYNSAVAMGGRIGEVMLISGTVNQDNATLHVAEAYLAAKWHN